MRPHEGIVFFFCLLFSTEEKVKVHEYSLKLIAKQSGLNLEPVQIWQPDMIEHKEIPIIDRLYPAYLYISVKNNKCTLYNELPCEVDTLSMESLAKVYATFIMFDATIGKNLISKYKTWREQFPEDFLTQMLLQLHNFQHNYTLNEIEASRLQKFKKEVAKVRPPYICEQNFVKN